MSKYLAAEDKRQSPVLLPDGSLENFTLRIMGKPHRCVCLCNVFHKPNSERLDVYECNGCGNQFEAV